MPLRRLPRTVAPAPVIIPPKPLPAPPAPAREYFEWTPAGGPTMVLADELSAGIMLGGIDDGERAVIGLDMPPQEEFDTALPGGGELANGRRWGARPFSLPVVIHADTLDQLRGYRRALITAFNPERGDGEFTVAYPDGTRLHLAAAYSSGLDVAERGRAGYPYMDGYVIVMKARDPFPYGDEQIITFAPPETYEFFAPPGDTEAVFYLSSGNTSGDVDVDIDGQVEVWPEWRIRGPAATATLRNRDTGKTLQIAPNLTAGQTLIIRTNERTPMAQKVTRNGSNVWTSVIGSSAFPVFWSLQPGANRVTVLLTGTVPGQSTCELRYRPRELSA